MKYEDLKLPGGTINGELVEQFFDTLLKSLTPYQIIILLRKFIYNEVNFKELLSDGGVVSENKFKQMERDRDYLRKSSDNLRKKLETEIRRSNNASKAKVKAEREVYEYVEAIRYYEDFMASIKMRKEILDRTKYSEIFVEEEEGWTT